MNFSDKVQRNILICFLAFFVVSLPVYSLDTAKPAQKQPEQPNQQTETAQNANIQQENTLPQSPVVSSQNQTSHQTVQTMPPDLNEEITLCLPKDQVPISLDQAIGIALDNNYNIKIVASQRNQSKWEYYNSLTTFLPNVEFNYEHIRFNGAFLIGGVAPTTELIGTGFPTRITSTTITTGFAADWAGFTGLSRFFNTQAFRNLYRASKRNLDLTQDQVLLLTTSQYYSLLQAKLNIQIQQRALEQTQAQLALNQQRFNAGVGTMFDVLRSQAEVAAARENLISAYNSLRLAQSQLANTIGINVFTPLMPVEEDIPIRTLFKDCFDPDKVTDIALKSKPELDIAKLNIAAARAVRNSGYSVYLPTVAVSTSVNGIGDRINNLLENDSVALLVNWQFGRGLGLAGYTSIKALNEQLKQAELRLVDTRRNIEQSLINSFYNSLTAKELIEASRSQVISAQESLRLAVVRLEAGVGIYTDVINAQLTETQARVNHLNAIINYNVAQAQLMFDMGVISPSNLLEGYEIGNDPNIKKK